MPQEKRDDSDRNGHDSDKAIPLGLTPEAYARLAARKAANATQTAIDVTNVAHELKSSWMLMAGDISRAKNDARDAKIISLAIARHFNIAVSELDGSVPPPRPKVSSFHDLSQELVNPPPALVPYDDSQEVLTGTGHRVIVGVEHYNKLSVSATEYDRGQAAKLAEFEAMQKASGDRRFLDRWDKAGRAFRSILFVVFGGALTKLLTIWVEHKK